MAEFVDLPGAASTPAVPVVEPAALGTLGTLGIGVLADLLAEALKRGGSRAQDRLDQRAVLPDSDEALDPCLEETLFDLHCPE